jgi:hypothetical protein
MNRKQFKRPYNKLYILQLIDWNYETMSPPNHDDKSCMNPLISSHNDKKNNSKGQAGLNGVSWVLIIK